MELWQRLHHLKLSWGGLAFLIAFQVCVLFLRRLLPLERKHRGRWSSYALLFVPPVSLLANFLTNAGLPTVGAWLHIFNVTLTATVFTSAAGMVVFDILLARTRYAVPDLVRDLVYAGIFAVIGLVVLQSGGFQPLSVAFTSAALTAVVGLAMQNSLANLGAGILLQFDRSIRVGDWIQVGSRSGRVETFNWRSTAMRTSTGDLALLPNTQLLSSEVLNLSQPERSHRVAVKLSFHHRHSPGEVTEAVTRALSDVPGVLSDPPPSCVPTDFAGSTVVYHAFYWIDDLAAEARIDGEVLTRVWYAASRNNLEGPSPARAEPGAPELAARHAALARTGLLAPLSADRRDLLAPALRPLRYAAGERIITQGEAGDSMFLLAEGEVTIERVHEGVAVPVATLKPGDHFGEMSLLTGASRLATCRAATACLCYALDGASFGALLGSHPELAEAITGLVSQRQRETDRARESLTSAREGEAALWARVKGYFHL